MKVELLGGCSKEQLETRIKIFPAEVILTCFLVNLFHVQ